MTLKGQEENGQHDGEEHGQGQVFVGDHPVDGLAAGRRSRDSRHFTTVPAQMVSMKV